jgi:hypothetical protein
MLATRRLLLTADRRFGTGHWSALRGRCGAEPDAGAPVHHPVQRDCPAGDAHRAAVPLDQLRHRPRHPPDRGDLPGDRHDQVHDHGGSGTASVSSVPAGINWKSTLVRSDPTTNAYRMVGKGTESMGASPVQRPVKVTGTLTVEPTPSPTIKGTEDVYPLPSPAA